MSRRDHSNACDWCGHSFRPRLTGGKGQRFCSAQCRKLFHSALHAYAARKLEQGGVSIRELRATIS